MSSSDELSVVFSLGGAVIAAACVVYVAASLAAELCSGLRLPRPHVGAGSLLSFIGAGLAVTAPGRATPAHGHQSGPMAMERDGEASERRSPPSARERLSRPPAPPWSEPTGFTPPRLLGRTGEVSTSPGDGVRPHEEPRRRGHRPPDRPAGRQSVVAHDGGDAGGSKRSRVAPERVQVKPGDSLWSIAADVLGTADPARIARYWPRIHRANRQVIGANPNLIFPGQILELPAEEAST